MDKQGFAVSEVNQYLKQLLESQSELHHIPVLGEISNFKRYGSGHCYFTLKDLQLNVTGDLLCHERHLLNIECGNDRRFRPPLARLNVSPTFAAYAAHRF